MIALCFVLAASASPPPVAGEAGIRERPKLAFGAATDMVFTSGTALRFSATAPMLAGRPAAAMSTGNDFSGEATFALAMDYFLFKRMSVGGFVRASYAWSQTVYGPGFGVGPRIGYYVPFADWVGLWPRLDLSFGAQASTVRPIPPATDSQAATVWFFNATANLPLVFSILDHVVLGVGPYFAFEPQWLSGNTELSAFGFNFGVSSFFGWHF